MKKTLLLVEDSKLQKIATERILNRAGYLVLSAEDGEEALSLAREAIPDLILLDMLLPKLGGLEVLLTLKANRVTSQIPVIVLSSLPPTNEKSLMTDGAAAYFEKSRLSSDEAGERDLLEIIQTVLQKSDERKTATRAKAAASRG